MISFRIRQSFDEEIGTLGFQFSIETLDLVPSDIAQYVERRTREHNVSGHYRLWVPIPGWPTKITDKSFG